MAQRRPGEHLCPALPVPRVRLPAGDEQRGLALHAEVRHSGAARSQASLRAVAGAAQYTSFRPLFAVLFVTPRNKDDMGDCVPTDQLSHNHCDCTDSHCNSHIVLRVCLCFLLSHHQSQVHRRHKQLSDFDRDEEVLDAPEELRQPVVGVGGAQEEQGQEMLASYT